MKWTKVKEEEPPKNTPILIASAEFCESGYVVAKFNGENYEVDGHGVMDEEPEAWSKIKPYFKSMF